MPQKISVVIPNYNGINLLKKNLPGVIKNFPNSQIIVSDDQSSDNSVNWIKENFPSVDISVHKKNLGFSSTANDGAKLALGEVIVLLNTDVSVKKDYTERILKYFDDKNLFGIGFQDRSYEKEKIVLRGRGGGSFNNGLLKHYKGSNESGTTLWISGGSCAVSREKFEKLGGFNPIFNPFYWEDIDLSYRALKSGWAILFTPEIEVDHYHEAGAIRTNNSASRINQIALRNMFIFSAKNITDTRLLTQFYLYIFLLVVKSVIKADSLTIKAIILFLLKMKKIIRSKNFEKKLYKLTDTEVIKYFGNAKKS